MKEKNKMVRDLLYSICLHLLFILFIIFSDKINKVVNNSIANINVLNIDSDFLEKNEIKATEENNYSELSLREKVELYNLSKKNYDENKKFTEVSEKTLKKKLKAEYPVQIGTELENGEVATIKNEVIYIGPTDYRKYETRIQAEKVAERLKKEALKKEAEEKAKKEMEKLAILAKEEEASKFNDILKKIELLEEKPTPEENKKEEELLTKIDPKNEVDDKISEILEDNKIVLEEKKPEETKIEKEESIEEFNIDINKIFTRQDIRNIKKYLREELSLQSLSVREKVNIQNQIVMCYKNAIIQTGKNNKVRVSVTLKLFQDGIIDTKEIRVKILDNKNLFTKEDYNDAVENIKLALAYCNPLRNLPIGKYESWKNINFVFDATTME